MKTFLACFLLVAATACSSKKNDPAPSQPANTVFVSVNKAAPVQLAGARVTSSLFSGAASQVVLGGALPGGRTIEVRYRGTAAQPATSAQIPLAAVSLFTIADRTTLTATTLSGSLSNVNGTRLVTGTFTASFSDGTALDGAFREVPAQ